MNWAKEYLRRIQSGEEVVGKLVRAVYERECSWMEDPPEDFPYFFDETEGQAHIDFIEKFCKQSKGKTSGQPLRLELFQKARIQLAFGWRHKETRLRRFREVINVQARKTGKSTETAGLFWDMSLNDGENGFECYCAANTRDQARVIFSEICNMRTQSPALSGISRKRKNDIAVPYLFGTIAAVSAEANNLDGLNASFFALDEFWAAKTDGVYAALDQSTSARDQPLGWLISSNGYVRNGFFDDHFATARNIALWMDGFQDYSTLPILYQLDEEGEWQKPECWAKANPGLGVIKKLDALERQVQKAKLEPSHLPTVLCKDFCLPQNQAHSWLTFEEASNDTVMDMEYFRKTYAVGGCDLSATTDLTCATLLIQRPDDPNTYVHQMYFIPQAKLDKVLASERPEAPYDLWAKKGWVRICEGTTITYSDVTAWFDEMRKDFQIIPLVIGYDRALAGYWVEEMEDHGHEMEKIAQGPFTWSYPMKLLKGEFEAHRIVYQNNPVLKWCLLNTGVKSQNRNGIDTQMPEKAFGSVNRIDGMVSLLNAWTCLKKHEVEYNERKR